MANISLIFLAIQISLFGIIILSALIYSIPIIYFQCFRYHVNIFTLNLCLAITGCSLYWIIYYTIVEFNSCYLHSENTCMLIIYAQMMFTLQVPFAFIILTVHRYCSIVYHTKHFFKTKQCIAISVIGQWIAAVALSLPMFLNHSLCILSEWKRIYALIMIVIIPSLIYMIMNGLIVNYVRSSSRQVQPQIKSIQTFSHNTIRQQPNISRRDVRLLRHMMRMFCIFVGGRSPIYIVLIIAYYIHIDLIVPRFLSLLADLSLLGDILDLFIYNHELRHFFKNIILTYFRT
ncbi:unnamed protein product [Rotaria sp. Silwood2]|nr:unnamed protein product [Rotaria sp. Silwood2]CAF4118437.1 unnamed protein product [Rotaria sp. Silwood2]